MRAHRVAILSLALGVAAGCSSPIEGKLAPVDAAVAGATPLRRLTATELRHTLEDLLGAAYTADWEGLGPHLPADVVVDGLDTLAGGMVPGESYVRQAHGLAEHVVANVSLPALVACGEDRGCVPALLDGVGRRALRRPVTAEEHASYLALYDDLFPDGHAYALSGVLTRLLQSPDFLYHLAVGDSTTGRLTDHEQAARLSYLLWETMPDAELAAAADAGQLHTAAEVEAQLARMVDDPRTERTLRRFYASWLRLDELGALFKDPEAYPEFAALAPSMRASVEALLADAVADGDLATLLTSSETYVDDALAAFHGVAAPGPGELARVALDPEQYAGVLTHPAFMSVLGKAERSGPILRGVFVMSRMLCIPPEPPPPGAEVIPIDAPDLGTTREFFAALTSPGPCQGCHAAIDPLGFAFEHYDGMGRYRDLDNGFPVDASGEVVLGGVAVTFADAIDLVQAVAERPEVQRCVVDRWFRSRFGRTAAPGDRVILDALEAAFTATGARLRGLAEILAATDALYRPHLDLEVAP